MYLAYFPGMAIAGDIDGGSIHKKYGFAMADRFGQVWRELVRAEDFDILDRKSSLQSIGSVPGQAVVAA